MPKIDRILSDYWDKEFDLNLFYSNDWSTKIKVAKKKCRDY